jgi:DDE superfamily endonuclease
MWCIAALTKEYRQRMYHLLALYARPLRSDEPVVCIDEKSLQLLAHSRAPMPCNLFVAVEPRAGKRNVVVTDRRGKSDFVAFVQRLLETTYRTARRLHLVLDNLNTHFEKSFVDVLGSRQAAKLLRRVRFHYTPKHASWLNMAEIEIGVLTRQCLNTRVDGRDALQRNVTAWERRRNEQRKPIIWSFTRQKADAKLRRHYVS